MRRASFATRPSDARRDARAGGAPVRQDGWARRRARRLAERARRGRRGGDALPARLPQRASAAPVGRGHAPPACAGRQPHGTGRDRARARRHRADGARPRRPLLRPRRPVRPTGRRLPGQRRAVRVLLPGGPRVAAAARSTARRPPRARLAGGPGARLLARHGAALSRARRRSHAPHRAQPRLPGPLRERHLAAPEPRHALPQLLATAEAQLAVLGSGDARYEAQLRDLAAAFPRRVAVRIEFNEPLAHRIEAGGDVFLMPSRFEPCGLNQLYSLRYGTVPVVHATGGLDDSVVEFDPATGAGTGFKFSPYTPDAFLAALARALRTRRDPALWAHLIANGMAQDFSWSRAAAEYRALYETLVGGRTA